MVADDDFAIISVPSCVIHFAFIPPLIVWFALVRNPDETCPEQMSYTTAYSGIIGLYTISLCLEVAVVVFALRGTPLDQKNTNRRRWIARLVHADTVSHILQLAFVSYLTYVGVKTFKQECYSPVAWNHDAFAWSLVAVFFTYMLFGLVLLAAVWDYSGSHRHANECWDRTYMHCLWASVLWFAWNPFSGEARRYHQERAAWFGKNMKSLFGHSDMSFTDMVLAFMNTRHRARHSGVVVEGLSAGLSSGLDACLLERGTSMGSQSLSIMDNCAIRENGTGGAGGLGGDGGDIMTLESLLSGGMYKKSRIQGEPVEHEVVQDVLYYYKYALAAYGWMMYFLGRGFPRGLWALLFGGRGLYFPAFRGKANVEIACREIGTTASNILFLRESGHKDNVLCYVIALDHERKSVVISVRGAVTVDDNVRDMLLDPGELNGWLDAASKGCWEVRPPVVKRVSAADLSGSLGGPLIAQGDYLEACRATLCDILDCGVLEGALRDHEGFGLTFVGHSLGAVGSFFLALYFQPWIPNVRCWCYSPPAGLVDVSVAESCGSWCTSVVNGKEIVPRFSAASLDRARDELVCSLATVDVPKWRRIYRLLWKYWDVYQADVDLTKPMDPASLSEDAREFLEDYVRSRNDDEHRRYLVASAERMSLPGKVIYFEPIDKEGDEEGDDDKDREKDSEKGKTAAGSRSLGPFQFELDLSFSLDVSVIMSGTSRKYKAKYVPNAAMKNQGVILSGRLLSDHMPDYAEEVLLGFRESLAGHGADEDK